MVPNTKENTKKTEKMDFVRFNSKMETFMREILKMINFMGLALTITAIWAAITSVSGSMVDSLVKEIFSSPIEQG